MAGEKGRMPWPAVTALLVIALGIIAVTLRHRVTIIDGTVLLLERWSGHVTLIQRDGRFSRIDGRNPGRPTFVRLPDLFKPGTAQPARKTAAGTPKKPASERTAPSRVDAAAAQLRAPAPTPFGSGAVTSKDLPGTGAKIYASVNWEGEQGRFRMSIRPYTDEVKKLRRSKKSTIRIDLVDAKGAVIMCLTIPVGDMRPVRDEKKKIAALEYSNGVPLGKADFRTIQDWKIREVPQPSRKTSS